MLVRMHLMLGQLADRRGMLAGATRQLGMQLRQVRHDCSYCTLRLLLLLLDLGHLLLMHASLQFGSDLSKVRMILCLGSLVALSATFKLGFELGQVALA